MVWYYHLFKNSPKSVANHTVNGFSIVIEAEVDVLFCFVLFCFCNSLTFFMIQWIFVNLISGSSAFCKSRLNIWKFSIHILLKPTLKDFELVCEMRAIVQ